MNEKSLSLAHYHFKRTINGLTVIGTWIHDEERTRSCLVLIRQGEEKHDMTVPVVISEDDAWIFCGIDGVAEPHRAIPMAIEFAKMLRMSLDKASIYKIIKTIEDHVGDLVSIPPFHAPVSDAPVIADMTVRNVNTGKVEEMEIRDVRP